MLAPSWWPIVSDVGMILVGLLAVVWATRGARSLWRQAGLGAAAWLVAVALKFLWALPMNRLVRAQLVSAIGTAFGDPVFYGYVGLLTGVFECGFVALLVARTALRRSNWRESLAFGTGFGAVEAIALGVVASLSVTATILFWQVLPADTKAKVVKAYAGHDTALALAVPVFERMLTLFIHAFSCVAVIYGFRAGRPVRWFAVAFVYKSAVDGVAAWSILALGARQSIPALLRTELMLVPFGVAGLIGLVFLHRRMKGTASEVAASG